jgi:hypothetical protein
MYMLMLIFDVLEHGYWEPPNVTVQLLHNRNTVQITSIKILILSMSGPWLILKIPMGQIRICFLEIGRGGPKNNIRFYADTKNVNLF